MIYERIYRNLPHPFFRHDERKKMEAAGISYSLEPVPRSLSSSCGTCIRFQAEDWKEEWMDKDCDSIYEVLGEKDKNPEYQKIISLS